MRSIFLTIVLFLCTVLSAGAQGPFRPQEGWIGSPEGSPHDYGVYYFRKDVRLSSVPKSMRVQVSGDNRYKLFVNGRQVALGPARSDLSHWNCDLIDLAPYLRQGINVVVAKVVNEGALRPEANMTYRTAFMLRPVDDAARLLMTDSSWKCILDRAYAPLSVSVPGYYAAGPGEMVDMRQTVADWNEPTADLSRWKLAEVVAPFTDKDVCSPWGTYPGWLLQQNPLPQMELSPEKLLTLRKVVGVKHRLGDFLGLDSIVVAPHSDAELIFDQRYLTNAYPTLDFSWGRGGSVVLGYAEGLYDVRMRKGNRNDLEGKHFVGRRDSILPDGRAHQLFTPMSWRTYRYIVLRVHTADEPLAVNSLQGEFTGFPFRLQASLDTDSKMLRQMMDIGWRTARLCAMETYMDCPYYEQLQYFGDARIQALVSLMMTGDERLVRNFLNMADRSRSAAGVTQSRYPSNLPQWIPTYALHYIYALHDYMMYGRDMDFLKDKLMGMRAILDYFHHYQQADGRVGSVPGWDFTDWVDGRTNWKDGVAQPGSDGCNAVMDLQLLYAYQMAADLERHFGMNDFVSLYQARAGQLRQSIQQRYWRAGRGLYSDRADSDVFSQHAAALAILTGLVEGDSATEMGRAIESDTTLAPASIYFKFYTHQAMIHAGLGDHYLQWLGKWKENIDLGMTTWGETSDVEATRSDCHAWGSSPNIEFMRTLLGIDSDSAGFASVRIEPHLCGLTRIGGRMPHPRGIIGVNYQLKGKKLKARIELPKGLSGIFIWQGQQLALHEGLNEFSI